MKPAPFEYLAPTSLTEVLEAVTEYGDEAKLLAGGQSLIPAMNFRIMQPSVLIDLNRVSELAYIDEPDEPVLRFGALTRLSRLEDAAVVSEKVPLLSQALPLIAHPQIRNRSTIGGSLVHADPAAELPVVAVALNARVKLQNRDGSRWIEAPDFFKGMFTTDTRPDEVLVEVELPAVESRTGTAFQELARRPGDYAMAGVACVIRLDEQDRCTEARLVYLNVGDGPVVAVQAAATLEGEQQSEDLFQAAAKMAAEEEINPFGNVHATPEYQRHLARVLTGRALAEAWARALAA